MPPVLRAMTRNGPIVSSASKPLITCSLTAGTLQKIAESTNAHTIPRWALAQAAWHLGLHGGKCRLAARSGAETRFRGLLRDSDTLLANLTVAPRRDRNHLAGIISGLLSLCSQGNSRIIEVWRMRASVNMMMSDVKISCDYHFLGP
jgi:hypothetical protein